MLTLYGCSQSYYKPQKALSEPSTNNAFCCDTLESYSFDSIVGSYEVLGKYRNLCLTFHKDSTYQFDIKPKQVGDMLASYCKEPVSFGRWHIVHDKMIELLSLDTLLGADYLPLHSFSEDSLYIKVSTPNNDASWNKLRYVYEINGVSYSSNDSILVLNKHMSSIEDSVNTSIKICVICDEPYNVYSDKLFEKRHYCLQTYTLDIEHYNYLLIEVPYFDVFFCFKEYYNQELIEIVNTQQIIWRGNSYVKQKNNE